MILTMLAGSIRLGVVGYIVLVSENFQPDQNIKIFSSRGHCVLVQGAAQAIPWELEIPKFPRCINDVKPPGQINAGWIHQNRFDCNLLVNASDPAQGLQSADAQAIL